MLNSAGAIARTNPLTHLFAIWREPSATGHLDRGSILYVLGVAVVLAVVGIVAATRLRRAAFWF